MEMEEPQDWKLHMQPASRLRITKKIMEHVKRHIPVSCLGGLLELTRIAVRFEEKMYMSSYSQTDYLRKISLKMLALEKRPANNNNEMVNPLPLDTPNSVGVDDRRWQNQFQVDFRQRIVRIILATEMKHLPLCGPAEFLEATEVAVRFEESVYTTATDELDYLHKISLKILSLEVNSEK